MQAQPGHGRHTDALGHHGEQGGIVVAVHPELVLGAGGQILVQGIQGGHHRRRGGQVLLRDTVPLRRRSLGQDREIRVVHQRKPPERPAAGRVAQRQIDHAVEQPIGQRLCPHPDVECNAGIAPMILLQYLWQPCAGDAGKGFSVVADEIRKLSETSTTQSKAIGEQLNQIKDSISEVVSSSEESSNAFKMVSQKIQDTVQLVTQIKGALSEQNEGSKQISDTIVSLNDNSSEVKGASTEMSQGNQAILEEVKRLQDATSVMKDSMEEMSVGAKKINETGTVLNEISSQVKGSIDKISGQIDQFKV